MRHSLFILLRTFASVLLACTTTLLWAQQYNFRTYTVDNGLSQSQATSMCQGADGFIWIGSLGGGLNRFDGKEVTVYGIKDGLPDNNIWDIITDKKGQLWIATAAGLSRFDGKSFHNYTTDDGLCSNEVWALLEDSKGQLWVGTGDNGVSIYDGETFRHIGADALGFDNVNCLLEDAQGNVWVGSFGNGIAVYNGQEFTHYKEEDGLSNNIVRSLAKAPDGKVWVGTDKGITIFDGGTMEYLNDKAIFYNSIEYILFHSQGSVWIATENQGVYQRQSNGYIHFNETNGLSSDYTYALLEDNVGGIWISTNGGGVCKYEGEMFTHYTKADGLLSNVVMGVLEDHNGWFWMATDRGLSRYNGEQVKNFQIEDGLRTNDLQQLHEDENNNIWISAITGVGKMNEEGTITWYDETDGFTNSSSFTFYEDTLANRLYITTIDGIYVYANGAFSLYEDNDKLHDVTNRIYKDSKGCLWFCTDQGVVFKNKDWRYYTTDNGLISNRVLDIWEDGTGQYWLLTDKGISVMGADHSFITIDTDDGLASDNLYSMLYHNQHLWVGSEKGIDRLTLNKTYQLESVKHYGKEEGFKGVECNSWAMMEDEAGYLWVGTIKGMTRYNSAYDQPNTVPPLIKLTSLRLLYEQVNWSEKCEHVEGYVNMPHGVCLTHEDNHLTFDFIGVDYKNPDKIKYQFKLEGFDAEWSPVTDLNFATYSNLPPGSYNFLVKARNDDGLWNQPVSYEFVIQAPFWMKTWFYLVTVPLGILLLYLVIMYRTKQLARSKRLLEETVRQRTMEISQQKAEVEKLSLVASETADGVLIANGKGELEWMNEGVTRMTGYNFEEFKASFGDNIIKFSSYEQIRAFVNGEMEDNFVQYDFDFYNKQGELRWANATVTLIHNEQGKLQRVIAIYSDMTDRKEMENTLMQTNEEITESIRYAKQIQEAILPSKKRLFNVFPESFVFYRPKDIVSGDFYWFSHVGDVFIMAAADCTGHGVPGAFMSMIGNEFLHQIVNTSHITGPEQALSILDKRVNEALSQKGAERESKDGMDIALCAIHLNNLFFQYAGAFNPLYIIRNGELMEYKASKNSIGGYNEEKHFKGHELHLQENDIIYIFSDGFIDQFGGPKGKKFMRRRFKELLLHISTMSMEQQHHALAQEFDAWKGAEKQVDDILVIGVKITQLDHQNKKGARTTR